jgi:enolase
MGNDMQAMDPAKTEVVKTDSSYQVNNHESQIESVIWINALNFTMAKKELKNKVINQTYEMDYDDYRLLTDRLFSYRRRVRLAAKEVYNLNIEYQKVTLDEPQKFSFNVPEKYLVVKPETKEEKK